MIYTAIAVFMAIAGLFWWMGTKSRQPLLIFASASIILLAGLSLLLSAMEIPIGTLSTATETVQDNVTYIEASESITYGTITPIFSRGLGLTLVAVAVWAMIITWDFFKVEREEGML